MTVEDPAEGFLSEEDMDRRTRLLARVQGRGEATPLHEHLGREAASLLSVSSSALIVMSGKEVGTVVAASEDGGVALDDLQFTLGEGPCLEAYRTSSAVLVPDLQADGFQRWPMFADAASRAGAGAVFAIPLQLGAIRMGVLYLTRSTPAPLSGEDLSNAFVLADLCTLSLLDHQAEAPLERLGPAAQDGWAHRGVVHQATGMVAVQLDRSLDDAIARLRSKAFAEGRSLYELAADVVARRVRFEG